MKTSGIASKTDEGQVMEFAASVVRALPRDLDAATRQRWICNPMALKKALSEALLQPWEKMKASPLVPLKHDKTKDGWTLVEDVPFDGKEFIPDIVEFLRGESYTNGEVMKQRAKELNAHLGQRHAEYLLEHQELIPKEWEVSISSPSRERSGGAAAVTGVPYLRWDGDRWYLRFDWLEFDWCGSDRLVRSRG